MNRIEQTFKEKVDILNIYFTAGYPRFDDTIRIAKALEDAGADMLEIGIPFSDPVADGPTIQESSQKALENGMTLTKLFDQLVSLRETVTIPVLLMGYVNPIIQFGISQFCNKCVEVGIDGVIVPDLPMQEYLKVYQHQFKKSGIKNTFLISPNTSNERIELIDGHTDGFIYMVSSSSITGAKSGVQSGQIEYYKRISAMNLRNPRLIGFGISDKETFKTACQHANGAIIGSAFVKELKEDASEDAIKKFIKGIKGQV
ncbi:tryptophan synthase subunit alpha [Ekhidna sp.]|uniref:tryptophan synthase subunit alpha n=1 Tax=Ekhidna sp. TaxID=2608089 RepID=UPI003BAC18AE